MTTSPQNTDWQERFDVFLDEEFDKKNKVTKGETHRWILCEDKNRVELWQKNIPDDCACCLDDSDHGKQLNEIDCNCHCHYRISQIKSFIQSEKNLSYQQGRESMREEILEGMPKKATESDGWDMLGEESCCPGDDCADGFNMCRRKIKKLLKK